MNALPMPCRVCGTPSLEGRCPAHRPPDHRPSPSARGYDRAWRRLSRYVRALSPVCADCGATDDLTADHLRWPATGPGDVEVVCRACNSRRGARRVAGDPSVGVMRFPAQPHRFETDCEAGE